MSGLWWGWKEWMLWNRREMMVDFGVGKSPRYLRRSVGYSLTTHPLPKVSGIPDAELETKANMSFAIRF
jgi:hypothetical protein